VDPSVLGSVPPLELEPKQPDVPEGCSSSGNHKYHFSAVVTDVFTVEQWYMMISLEGQIA
jgi:hypothetical protein